MNTCGVSFIAFPPSNTDDKYSDKHISGTGYLDGGVHRLRLLCSYRVHNRELHLEAGHQEQVRHQQVVSGDND